MDLIQELTARLAKGEPISPQEVKEAVLQAPAMVQPYNTAMELLRMHNVPHVVIWELALWEEITKLINAPRKT